jgi:hypothetical protein
MWVLLVDYGDGVRSHMDYAGDISSEQHWAEGAGMQHCDDATMGLPDSLVLGHLSSRDIARIDSDRAVMGCCTTAS